MIHIHNLTIHHIPLNNYSRSLRSVVRRNTSLHMFHNKRLATTGIQRQLSPSIQSVGSCQSSISAGYEEPHLDDVQSIVIQEDLQLLMEATYEDTKPFVPNIQYGKVLGVYPDGSLMLAARIYNGYTKVLAPVLYHINIHLHGVVHPSVVVVADADKPVSERLRDVFCSNRSTASSVTSPSEILTTLLLGKIVIVYNVYAGEHGKLYADVYHDNVHINRHMNHIYTKSVSRYA